MVPVYLELLTLFSSFDVQKRANGTVNPILRLRLTIPLACFLFTESCGSIRYVWSSREKAAVSPGTRSSHYGLAACKLEFWGLQVFQVS